MPFTFSHPALVIPLLRGRSRWAWVSATGLITGSVAPDFEKFFRLHLASGHSHTLASIVYFSLPVSIVLAFVFHELVRQPLLAHLPAWLQRRVGRFAELNWPGHFRRHFWGVVLSILLGAAGHLFWDSFTHPSAIMQLLPAVAALKFQLGPRMLSIYQVSAVVNSVLGGLAIGWGVWRLPARAEAVPAPAQAAPWGFWGRAALVAGLLLALWQALTTRSWIDFGIAAISASMVGLLVASAWFRWSTRPAEA